MYQKISVGIQHPQKLYCCCTMKNVTDKNEINDEQDFKVSKLLCKVACRYHDLFLYKID